MALRIAGHGKGKRKAPTDADRETGRLFRAARERSGLSQNEAARRADYSKDSIYKIERGEVWPPYDALQRLAGAYGIAVGDFFPNSGASAEVDLLSPLLTAMRGLTERQQREMVLHLASQVRMTRAFLRGNATMTAEQQEVVAEMAEKHSMSHLNGEANSARA